jgi:pectin methylesterase-like acyl-CoA thioesterase
LKPLDYFSAEAKAAREATAKEKAAAKQVAKYIASLSLAETQRAEAAAKAKENIIPTRDKIQLQNSLQATLDSVFMQKQEDKSIFLIYGNLDVTKYFVEIGKYMHHILEISIGTKDTK